MQRLRIMQISQKKKCKLHESWSKHFRFASYTYYFGVFTKSVPQHYPFISSHAQDISCCVGQLCFHVIPNISYPEATTTWISFTLHLLSLSLNFSSLLLSFSLYSSILDPSSSIYIFSLLFLFCTLSCLCFPLQSSNTKFKLTLVSEDPAFEPAHALRSFPGSGLDLH